MLRHIGIQKGLLEGRMEVQRTVARNLIAQTDIGDAMIAEISGLSVEEVIKLRASSNH